MPDSTYTHGYNAMSDYMARRHELQARFVMPHLRSDAHVLDVGCGPGTISLSLAAHVGRVVGVDVAEEEGARARAEASRRNTANADFRQGDGLALPFPDDAFDVVYANGVVEHVWQPVDPIREMLRVARPGGVVALRTSGEQ